jgi:hypothetical protein
MTNANGVNYIQNLLVEVLLLLVRAAVSTLRSGLALYRDKICYRTASCTTVLVFWLSYHLRTIVCSYCNYLKLGTNQNVLLRWKCIRNAGNSNTIYKLHHSVNFACVSEAHEDPVGESIFTKLSCWQHNHYFHLGATSFWAIILTQWCTNSNTSFPHALPYINCDRENTREIMMDVSPVLAKVP